MLNESSKSKKKVKKRKKSISNKKLVCNYQYRYSIEFVKMTCKMFKIVE